MTLALLILLAPAGLMLLIIWARNGQRLARAPLPSQHLRQLRHNRR